MSGAKLTCVNECFTVYRMIESFMHKGLEELFDKGKSAKVQPALAGGGYYGDWMPSIPPKHRTL